MKRLLNAICYAASLFCLLGAPAGDAQTTDLAPGVLFVSRALRHIRESMLALPNYTCLETISRDRLTPPSKAFRRVDLIRLEVARADGKELFSWPGAGKFEERSIADFAGGGLIGDGAFASFASDLFLNHSAAMRYEGAGQLEGRVAIRVSFVASPLLSRFTLQTASGSADVDYSGSFWVDPASLDLIRLDIRADNIPPQLRLSDVRMSIGYGAIKTGGNDIVLAQTSAIRMTDLSGEIGRDAIDFTNCRKFAGEARLLDAEDGANPTQLQQMGRILTLPGGLLIPLRLQTPVNGQPASVGDAITALVEADVLDKRQIWLPKGTLVRGRIRRLENRQGTPAYVLLGLEFSEAAVGPDTLEFIGRLQSVQSTDGVAMHHAERKEFRHFSQPNGVGTASTEQVTVLESFEGDIPGVSYLYLTVSPFSLPDNLRIFWKTETLRRQ